MQELEFFRRNIILLNVYELLIGIHRRNMTTTFACKMEYRQPARRSRARRSRVDDLLVPTDDAVRDRWAGSPAASSSISLLDVRLTRFAHPVNPLPTLGTTCRILHEHAASSYKSTWKRQITIKSNRALLSVHRSACIRWTDFSKYRCLVQVSIIFTCLKYFHACIYYNIRIIINIINIQISFSFRLTHSHFRLIISSM